MTPAAAASQSAAPAQLVESIRVTLPPGTRLALMGTIQFATALHATHRLLQADYPDVYVPQVRRRRTAAAPRISSLAAPQAKPLSPGETLGCTAPVLKDRDALVFVADGRFHLEVRASPLCMLCVSCVLLLRCAPCRADRRARAVCDDHEPARACVPL